MSRLVSLMSMMRPKLLRNKNRSHYFAGSLRRGFLIPKHHKKRSNRAGLFQCYRCTWSKSSMALSPRLVHSFRKASLLDDHHALNSVTSMQNMLQHGSRSVPFHQLCSYTWFAKDDRIHSYLAEPFLDSDLGFRKQRNSSAVALRLSIRVALTLSNSLCKDGSLRLPADVEYR